MKRILFTGVGRRVELLQAFRNAALVLNEDIKIYGTDMAGTAPALAYCDYTRMIVPMKDPNYIDRLIEICKNDKIDLVIPTIDTDLMVLAENRSRFETIGTRVMISAPDKVLVCRDKNNTSHFFVECGLKAPETVNSYSAYRGEYPAFIKPKDGSSSINAYRVSNIDELKNYAGQIGDYVIQPFIEGREYTIDIFCDWDGKPISIVPRERLQVRAGEVLKTQICVDSKMISEAKRICTAFKPCGPITVQLIRDSAGEDWFIEINPRYGGGAPLSMKAGARSAEAVLKLLAGEKVDYVADIADGAVYCRFDQSVCVAEGKGRIKGVIFDLDDTLYSEKEYVKSGYRAVSDYLGGGYEDILWTYFKQGKPAIDELLKSIRREDERENAVKIYREHKPDIHLYPGVEKMLSELKEKGYKIGIITDGRPEGQRKKINALCLDKLIGDENIIITDTLGGIQFRKPCDIAFRIIQNRWKLPAGELIYVGDNPEKDFQAPLQLGIASFWFENKDGIYYLGDDMASDVTINFCRNKVKNILEIEQHICRYHSNKGLRGWVSEKDSMDCK